MTHKMLPCIQKRTLQPSIEIRPWLKVRLQIQPQTMPNVSFHIHISRLHDLTKFRQGDVFTAKMSPLIVAFAYRSLRLTRTVCKVCLLIS